MMIQPDLAARLRQIGVVQPNPTFSPSSTADPIPSPPPPHHQGSSSSGPVFPSTSSNPVLSALEARRQIEQAAELDMEQHTARRFLNATTIHRALALRERGASLAQIEERLRLKKGVLAALGPEGLYKPVGDVAVEE